MKGVAMEQCFNCDAWREWTYQCPECKCEFCPSCLTVWGYCRDCDADMEPDFSDDFEPGEDEW